MLLPETDLEVPGTGGFFGHARYYCNQTSYAYNGPNGYNWWVRQMPYAVASGTSIAIVFDPNNSYWFDLSGGLYVARYGVVGVTLAEDTVNRKLTFVQAGGATQEVTVFNSFAAASPGSFVSRTDAGGVVISVTSRSGDQINELQRSVTVGGTTTIDSLLYAYFTSGTAAGKLQYVTWRRQVGGGAWSSIKRAAYAYYGPPGSSSGSGGSSASPGPFGFTNDLQTASQQLPNGSGGWNTVAVSYYRYYTSGFVHGLKLHFGPEAYRQLFNANLLTAADASVQPYADHYFVYDASARVTTEVAAVCAGCPGGGTTSDTFAYANNPHATNPRDPSLGYNYWTTKTTQTLPDGSRVIVYTNYCGLPMLRVTIDPGGTRMWGMFSLYDSNGRLTWEAHPSALNLPSPLSTLDAYDDLMNFAGGAPYMNASAGLIEVTEYYGPTDTAPGYVSARKLQQGRAGAASAVLIRSYTYTTNSDVDGNVVYPLASEVAYPDQTNTAITITTGYQYQWSGTTNQLQQKTIQLPATSIDQNGDGTIPTIIEAYDQYGNLTQRTDERGIVNAYVYEVTLGVNTQQIMNVQTGVTQPGVNVVSDYTYDNQGRLVQTLGPSHTVVLSGAATTVRQAGWIVYVPSAQPTSGTWGPDETRTGNGYATGTSPTYTYTLVNPVSIMRADKDGRTTDRITSRRTTGSGALSPADTFAQTDWRSWGTTQYNIAHQKTSERVYFLIPSSGAGIAGTNYGQTDYGYDALEHLNRTVAPGGTITRTVWTTPQRVASVWVGTNDTGATDSNPAGSGSPNNMVKVSENQYDGGNAGGDGNLTQVTQYVSATTGDTRVTAYGYDWRDRRTSMTDATARYALYTLDNLDRLTQTRSYVTSGGNLIDQSQTKYDDRGRAYQQLTYAVDPSTGTVGNALTSNFWYDYSGNPIQSMAAGAGKVFTKRTYNGVNWVIAAYSGYNTSPPSYSQAGTVDNDVILTQSVPTYDETGNIVSTASYDRLNDAPETGTGSTGALLELSGGVQPEARVSYTAAWFNGIARPIATANYGAVASLTRPSTPPSSSAAALVSQMAYDDAGRVYQTTDRAGVVNQTGYDNANRTTQTVEDVGSGRLNRTTNYTYTLDDLIATLTAVNATTGNQTTTYTYGTTLSESYVARKDLLRSVAYPDSTGSSDVVSYAYNRLGQQRTVTDQRGTIRTFYYDALGRPTNDCVTTNGTGTDVAVKQIVLAYEVRGMVSKLTSTDSPSQGAGMVLNQVQLDYNGFGQLVTEWQEHGGAVNTSTTPNVQYGYDAGAGDSNEVRLNTLTYPNARAITYDYGTSGGMNDYLNRVNAVNDGGTGLAAYTYLGLGTIIRIAYPQPGVWLDLWGGTSGVFNGFDLFNRVIDQRWQNNTGGTPADIDRYKYGYDLNSNRQYKANTVGTAAVTAGLDEYYIYDPLNRLTQMQRGVLNSTTAPTGITGIPAREMDYTLDIVGNWTNYVTKTGASTDLTQTRTQNKANEITAIGGTPGWATPPAYDPAGNMTTMPQVATPTSAFTTTYDAWNRMTGISNTGGTVATYQYDGRNRRIVKNTTATSETRHFYWTSNWQDIEERVGTSTSMDVQYVWGVRYIDELVCRDTAATPTRLYALQDANFNLTGITDASGNIAERYLFDPYGNRTVMNAFWTVLSGTAYAWVVGHQGLMVDVESGLIYNRYRYLQPGLGRFGSRDPAGYINDATLYEYERTKSVSYLDAFGLWVWPWDSNASWNPINTATIWSNAVLTGDTDPSQEVLDAASNGWLRGLGENPFNTDQSLGQGLYTNSGLFQNPFSDASDPVLNASIEGGRCGAKCWEDCMQSANAQAKGAAAGAAAAAAAWTAGQLPAWFSTSGASLSGSSATNFSALAAAVAWAGPLGRMAAQILINEHSARLAIRTTLTNLGVADETALISAGIIRAAQAALAGVIAAEAAMGVYCATQC